MALDFNSLSAVIQKISLTFKVSLCIGFPCNGKNNYILKECYDDLNGYLSLTEHLECNKLEIQLLLYFFSFAKVMFLTVH